MLGRISQHRRHAAFVVGIDIGAFANRHIFAEARLQPGLHIGPLWEAGCNSAYSDNVPFFAAAIEFLTGCMPYYIEGDFRDDRKDRL